MVRNQFQRESVSLKCDDVSRTKQSFRDETNINNIVKRWKKTGVCLYVNSRISDYRDVYGDMDLKQALDQVHEAQLLFDALPAAIRKEFANDASAFFEFACDPVNSDALAELGIGDKPKTVVAEPEATGTNGEVAAEPEVKQ